MRTVLVLGGIRSGKSEYAETLLASESSVRYLATAGVPDPFDTQFAERIAAHRQRREASPTTFETVQLGDPEQLIETLGAAGAGTALLVDDLGGWAAQLLGQADNSEKITALCAALGQCPARVVLVSPEVGLSVVPETKAGNEFADLMGRTNQEIADISDSVVLVVAGQPTYLKGTAPTGAAPDDSALAGSAQPGAPPAATLAATPVPAREATRAATREAQQTPDDALASRTQVLPVVQTQPALTPGMDLPLPDDAAQQSAKSHLADLDLAGPGLGELRRVVMFAAGVQASSIPAPWRTPRLLLLNGSYEGNHAAGDPDGARLAEAAQQGAGPYGVLCAQHEVSVQAVVADPAEPIEHTDACTPEAAEAAVRYGWSLADSAVDGGSDLLLIGSCGAGAAAAAATMISSITGGEVPALLNRIVRADGAIDDSSWMLRCAAARDALHRVRARERGSMPRLAYLGGPALAVATGIILGAGARRTPVLLDGPVGIAAGLLARDLASQSRHWCLLPDHGQDPAARTGADSLGLVPLFDLKTGLGEGTPSLLALPMLRDALTLAAGLDVLPPILAAPPGEE